MGDDELRAAAGRLLREEDGIGAGRGTDYVDGGFAADDAIALAKHYRATHPADDGEAVVTEEWLRSIGFCEYQGSDADIQLETLAGLYLRWAPINHFMLDECYVELPTRGHVRRLLRALGTD